MEETPGDLRRAKPAFLVLVAGMVLGLAACGSGSKSQPSQRTSSSTTTATATIQSPHTSPPPASHVFMFQSPSGNIGCVVGGGSARCDIAKRRWSPPAKPSDCPLDYGQGIEVSHGKKARFVCAGDTALDPRSRKLDYGKTNEADGFACMSRPDGMTCTDSVSRHGFFISAQSYGLF